MREGSGRARNPMRIGHRMLFIAACVIAQFGSGLPCRAAEESGLAAHFTFDEGAGATLHDMSGRGNNGVVHNAAWVGMVGGGALKFGRTGSYVDFGPDSPLKISGNITILAWAKLDAQPYPDNATNWVIVDCEEYQKSGFLVRIQGNTSTLMYRSSQEGIAQQRSTSIALANNTLYHIAVTKEGDTATYFINGAPDLRFHVLPPAPGDVPFMVSSKDQSFNGIIDDLKIYVRALSADEIKGVYEEEAESRNMFQEKVTRPRVSTGPVLRGKGFAVRVGPGGGMQFEIGDDVYFAESSYSYPGETIGYNHLSEGGDLSDLSWKPIVRSPNARTITVAASGRLYSLERRIDLHSYKVTIADTLTNFSKDDVGVIVSNALISDEKPTEWRLCGVPGTASATVKENPTVLLSRRTTGLGAVADDNVSRAQFRAAATSNHAAFRLEHLGLAPGRSITLEWFVYPLGDGEDYWTFINRIRADWDVNYRIDGPADLLHLTRNRYWRIFTDRDALRAFLNRSHLKIVHVGWLDYDNHHAETGELITREKYLELTRQVKETLRAVDPSVRLVGNIEAPYVSLPGPLCERLDAAAPTPSGRGGFAEMGPAQMRVFLDSSESWSRWKESVVWSAAGRAQHEKYFRRFEKDGPVKPRFALTVYPVMGNGQHEYLMEQAHFLLETAGLDGVYVDSYTSQRYSYDKWDGRTVDINPATGVITRRYTDCLLAATGSRKTLIEYILSAGSVCVINGHAVARETRSLPAIRFDEMFSYIDPLARADGEKPPFVGKLCYAHLSSPVGLGFKPDLLGEKGEANYAKVIMRAAISYLRHGVLYYHYETFIPETGPGSGEYGPFNHMFPITPVRLGEGFVEGSERTVTCVSGSFDWHQDSTPVILLFDSTGRPKSHNMKAVRTEGGFRVNVTVADWQEIAVLE